MRQKHSRQIVKAFRAGDPKAIEQAISYYERQPKPLLEGKSLKHVPALAADPLPRTGPDQMTAVSWSPDGHRFVALRRFKRPLMGVLGGGPMPLAGRWGEEVHAVAWSPDSLRLATAGHDGLVRVWDEVGACVSSYRHASCSVESVAWSADGQYVISGNLFELRVWEAATGLLKRQLPCYTTTVVIRQDQVFVGSKGGSLLYVRVQDLLDASQELPYMGILAVLDHYHVVAPSPDGARVATASGTQVSVWKTKTGQGLEWQVHAAQVSGLAWSPDGQQVSSVGHDKSLRVWDASTG